MAKKQLGYVELEWTCPHCGYKNPGSVTVCNSCGAPQPENVQFEQPAQENLITDEQKLQQAKAGPDIHCPYCGTRNPAGSTVCSQCGGDLTDAAARDSGKTVGAHRDQPAPEIPCPACGTMNPANAHRCAQCGSSLATPQAAPAPARVPQRKTPTWIFAVIGLVILACVAFAILSLRTEEVIGTVNALSWERTIGIEELRPVEHSAWYDDVPGNAILGSCQEKVRGTQDNPAPNSVEVCGTPYTVDEGSGFGQVVQDCYYEVYDDWCSYTVDEWLQVDEIRANGSNPNPTWPQLQLSGGQREGKRDENYEIVFDTDGRSYTYSTSNEETFLQCDPGSEWILNVNTFNAVVSIEPSN
ncbi:MAG: zinc finger protein [Chloroflexota bacterium]